MSNGLLSLKPTLITKVAFLKDLDNAMQEQNTYYKDLIQGKVLKPLKITKVEEGGLWSI